MKVLDVEKIDTYYGTSHILHGISFSMSEGQVVCLLGRNGAGKSATIRSIMGMTPPSSGSIRVFGEGDQGMEVRPHLHKRREDCVPGVAHIPDADGRGKSLPRDYAL